MIDTKTLRTTMSGKVIQLDYDWITSLDGCCSYCLTDAQVEMILGIVDYFGWSTRWYSESGLIDQSVINALQGGLVNALMCGCCGEDLSQLKRLSPEGHWQVSNDNGITWIDYPDGDPRRGVPLRPTYPVPVEGEEIPKCEWADSIVEIMKIQFVSELDASATIRDIFSALGGLLSLVLVITGVWEVLVALASIPAIIFAFGVSAMQTAFTDDVWNRFRCNLFENMGSTGINTQEQVDAIYNRVAEDETGIVVIVLQQIIALFGVQGMINAANAGYGSADADCSSCDEHQRMYVVAGGVGTEVSFIDNVLTAEAQLAGSHYELWLQWTLPDVTNNDVCSTATITVASGAITNTVSVWTCHSASPIAGGGINLEITCFARVAYSSFEPFTVTAIGSPDPCS